MIRNSYTDFSKDMLSLYCKIKHPVVEDLYLKFAKDYGQHIGELILANKKIRGKINNPVVYDALEFLALIKKDYGDNPLIGKIAGMAMDDTKTSRTFPVIFAFSDLIQNEQIKDILSPFSAIITLIDTTLNQDKDKNSEQITQGVLSDLLIIDKLISKPQAQSHAELSGRRMRVSEQRFHMFKSLLTLFSEDIAKACEASGYIELASKFREGILAKNIPDGLGRYKNLIELRDLSSEQVETAGRCALYAIEYCDPKYIQYNHSHIDIALLKAAGSITEDDAKAFHDEFRKERDIQGLLADEGKSYQSIDTYGKINMDQRMNTDYIYMLSVFFVIMQTKMGIPGVIPKRINV